jgi:hypothetical protein
VTSHRRDLPNLNHETVTLGSGKSYLLFGTYWIS